MKQKLICASPLPFLLILTMPLALLVGAVVVVLALFLFLRNRKRSRNNLDIKDGTYYKTLLFLITFLVYLLFFFIFGSPRALLQEVNYLLIYAVPLGGIFLGLIYIHRKYYFINAKKITYIIFGFLFIIFAGLYIFKLLSAITSKTLIPPEKNTSNVMFSNPLGCSDFKLF